MQIFDGQAEVEQERTRRQAGKRAAAGGAGLRSRQQPQKSSTAEAHRSMGAVASLAGERAQLSDLSKNVASFMHANGGGAGSKAPARRGAQKSINFGRAPIEKRGGLGKDTRPAPLQQQQAPNAAAAKPLAGAQKRNQQILQIRRKFAAGTPESKAISVLLNDSAGKADASSSSGIADALEDASNLLSNLLASSPVVRPADSSSILDSILNSPTPPPQTPPAKHAQTAGARAVEMSPALSRFAQLGRRQRMSDPALPSPEEVAEAELPVRGASTPIGGQDEEEEDVPSPSLREMLKVSWTSLAESPAGDNPHLPEPSKEAEAAKPCRAQQLRDRALKLQSARASGRPAFGTQSSPAKVYPGHPKSTCQPLNTLLNPPYLVLERCAGRV